MDHGAANLGSRSCFQRDAKNTETAVFTMSSAFVLYGSTSEIWFGLYHTRRIVEHSGQVALVCHGNVLYCVECVTLSTSGLRRCESWFYKFSAQVRKMSYFSFFLFVCFSFCHWCISNKRRLYSTGVTDLHMFHGRYSTREWVVHIQDKSDFCVRKTFFPVHNAWN